jgi:hypothetical protein
MVPAVPQMTPTKSGSSILPSARQAVESVLDASASGSGLQISLDLGDLDVGSASDGDDWEDVEATRPTSSTRLRQASRSFYRSRSATTKQFLS